MTQITKTLSIAGIIALVTAPAMAEIASTQYVQNIVNNIIPTSGTVGDVLKKTEDGVEWAAAPSVPEGLLTNTATGTDSFAIGNNVDATGEMATAIGGFSAYANGDYSLAINGSTEAYEAIAISGGDETAYTGSDASIAIGAGAAVSSDSLQAIAIGAYAYVDDNAPYAIQLGEGTNSVARTFNVSFGYNEATDETDNYTLLNSDGKIPAGRLPSGLLINNTVDDGAVAIGGVAEATDQAAIAIGKEAKATGQGSVALGHLTKGEESGAVAIGVFAEATDQAATAIGEEAQATAMGSVALGYIAESTQSGAVQLGSGTNNTEYTLQFRSFPLVDANGKIPAGRLPSEVLINTATGTDSFAIGNNGTYVSADGSIAIGNVVSVEGNSAVGIGNDVGALADDTTAIGGYGTYALADSATAIGSQAVVNEDATLAIQLGAGENNVARTFNVGFGQNNNYTLLESDGMIPYQRFAPTPDATCKASAGQKCALVVTWDGSKYSQSWEVVRSTSSGQ